MMFSDIPDFVGTQLISATWAKQAHLQVKMVKPKKNKPQTSKLSDWEPFFFYWTHLLISSFAGT